MRESRGGRGLASLGLAGDLSVCCAIDSMPILPELNAADGAIRIHA
jgi:phosphosulfolactate phosphohydrolase-like enzyme